MRRVAVVAVLCVSVSVAAFAGTPKPCVTPGDAAKLVNKDVCVAAHVYQVVRVADGTRFLDVCSPDMADEECRFVVVSYGDDRDTVGELGRYRDTDVRVRGMVEAMHGRAGMVVSHERQFRGGPPKFKANARLLRGFGGDMSRPAVADPNLRSQGAARSFMNRRNQEKMPGK